jgi:hypothetical protein
MRGGSLDSCGVVEGGSFEFSFRRRKGAAAAQLRTEITREVEGPDLSRVLLSYVFLACLFVGMVGDLMGRMAH